LVSDIFPMLSLILAWPRIEHSSGMDAFLLCFLLWHLV